MTERSSTRRILVPLDGSDLATRAITYVRALASEETELVLCRIVRDPTPLVKLAEPLAFPIERIRAPKLREAETYLADLAESLATESPRVATVCAVGAPPDEILRIAAEWAVDLIVMTTHGRGILGRMLIGSVADRVARAADVPVLLVRDKGNAGPVSNADTATLKRLVVPLDGSELARQALPVAIRFARHLEVPIHLVTAVPHRADITPDDDTLSLDFYDAYVTAVVESLRAEARNLRTPTAPATSEVIIGPPAEAILEGVTDDDVIVMASHGHGGMRRWWIGSVAERLTHIGKVPIMLVPVSDGSALAT